MNDYIRLFKSTKFVGSQPVTFDNNTYKPNIKYYCTHKLDGLRKLMLITKDQVHLISSKMDFQPFKVPIREELKDTVLDGEFVGNHFYAFDILFYKGRDLRIELLDERLKCLKESIRIQKSKKVIMKEYLIDNICNDFFTLKARYSKEMLSGEIDGIILTPNVGYLSLPPLKWKPAWLLSIDFKIHSMGNGIIHLLTQNGTIFKPKGKYSEVGTVKLDKTDIDKYKTGDVVEFIFKNGKFKPIRLRADKTNSNHMKVILSNFKSILNPPNVRKLLCN